MALASASPQPPADQPDIAQSARRSQHRQGSEQLEVYGPLCIQRHVKDDGRGLIVYARREQGGQ
ncbi:MAG: hypothetical protein ACRDJ3_11055 [Solirubrobacteraceae bacterium]